jgi:hypothetical protein
MKFPKRNDKKFTKDLLLKHLEEVKELIAKDDFHQYSEIEDLINIAEVWQKQHLSSSEIEELIAKRFERFMEKIHLDKD